MLKPGRNLRLIAVEDENVFRDNVFHYELVERSNHFYITTEPGSGGRMVGVLRIKKVREQMQ